MESKSLILGFDDNGRLFFSVENFWDWGHFSKITTTFLLLVELLRSSFYFRGTLFQYQDFSPSFFYHSCTFSFFGDPVKDKSKIKGSLFLDRSENQPHPLSLPLKNQDQVFSWTLFRSNFYPFCLTFIKNLKTNLNPSLFTQNQTTLSLIKAKTKTKATFTQPQPLYQKTSTPPSTPTPP